MSGAGSAAIEGDALADALTSGFHRVIGEQEYLNRINVFPVADSDTGTNLSLTLGSALAMLNNQKPAHLGQMLTSLADVLLDNARGNSGAIVAQFFQGMSDSAGDLTQFTTSTFAKAVGLGSEYANDALSKPCNGTILSVIAAFAVSLTEQATNQQESDLAAAVSVARIKVDEALAETPRQLDVLRKAGVVDAGAKGFAELVAGISDFLNTGEIVAMPDSVSLGEQETRFDASLDVSESKYRYCTECLVAAENIDRRKLREALADIGDSIVLAGNKHKAKIHIHADDTNAVFEIARQFGVLSGEKADDMHRQEGSAHGSSRGFAVITDSGADISDADMERLGIHMVPCRIQFGDRGYLDKVSISNEEFYAELISNSHHPTTSQPAPGDFRRQFQFLASHFDDVLSISLTSGASGTYEGARAAAHRVDAPGRIHVLDSRNASVGQGQLAVLAAECAVAGMGIDETVRIVESQIPHTKTFALLHDLRFAVRGGRLPEWVKTVADLSGLVPVICTRPDGRIGLSGCLLGRRNRITKFAKFVKKQLSSRETLELGIGQALCLEDAESLATELRKHIPEVKEVSIRELGTGLGVHGGPGTLIVSARQSH